MGGRKTQMFDWHFAPDLVIPFILDPDLTSKTTCLSFLMTPLSLSLLPGSWLYECGAKALWSTHLRVFFPLILTHWITSCVYAGVCVPLPQPGRTGFSACGCAFTYVLGPLCLHRV